MKLKATVLVTASLLLTACSSSIDPNTGERKDPLEGFNRAMWNVNYNYLDPYVVKPVAKGWRDYVPSPVKTGLVNVANNLDEPASFVNRLLEGEVKKAMIHFNRFWINSVFGIGGLIEPGHILWCQATGQLRQDKQSERWQILHIPCFRS